METARSQLNRPLITTRQLLYFFMPLAVSNALITVSHSLYNAGIARLSQPELYLAAFAVAKSMYQMIQFPSVTFRQGIAGLSLDSHSYVTARRFYTIILGVELLAFALLAFTPISYYLFTVVMGNSPEVARQAAISLRYFCVLPLVFSIRDFYGSVAIRLQHTYILFVGTIARVAFSVAIILVITKIHVSWDYLIPGFFFLFTGMIEAAAVFIGTKTRLNGYLARLDQMPSAGKNRKKLTYTDVATFAIPMFVMAFIQSLSGTFINGGLARTVSPELAIASFAVAWTLVMSIDTASGLFHQVILGFMEDDYSNRVQIMVFGVCVAVVLMALVAVLGFTPLGFWLMNTVIGASPQLSRMGVAVIRMSVVLPAMGVIRQYYWGIAMMQRKTIWLTIGSAIQVSAMILVIILLTLLGTFPSNPAVIGAVAVTGGTVFECVYLWIQKRISFKHAS